MLRDILNDARAMTDEEIMAMNRPERITNCRMDRRQLDYMTNVRIVRREPTMKELKVRMNQLAVDISAAREAQK